MDRRPFNQHPTSNSVARGHSRISAPPSSTPDDDDRPTLPLIPAVAERDDIDALLPDRPREIAGVIDNRVERSRRRSRRSTKRLAPSQFGGPGFDARGRQEVTELFALLVMLATLLGYCVGVREVWS